MTNEPPKGFSPTSRKVPPAVMRTGEQKVRRMIRTMNEIDRSEGRLRKFIDGQAYTKPSQAKKKKASLASWRRKVGPRDQEVRALDGSIWKGGKLLSPRARPVRTYSRIA